MFGKSQDTIADSAPPSPSVAASPYWGRKSTESLPPSAEGFSPLVGFCFTINYILGTGFLTVPWAFTQGGLILSTIVISLTAVFSDMAKNFVLETMARAEAMLDNQMHWIKRNPGDEEKLRFVYSPVIVKGDAGDLLQARATLHDYGATSNPANGSNSTPSLEALSSPGTPICQPGTPTFQGRRLVTRRRASQNQKYLVKHRKFEIDALARVFVGKLGLHIYTASLCLYIYCVSLTRCRSVFNSRASLLSR